MAKHVALVGHITEAGVLVRTGFNWFYDEKRSLTSPINRAEKDYWALNYLVVSDRAQPDD